MATDIPVTKFGAAKQWIAATPSMEYTNDGETVLEVDPAGADVTATHVEQVQCPWGHALTNAVDVAPAAGITQIRRGHQIVRFNDPRHKALITISPTAGVLVAAVSYA